MARLLVETHIHQLSRSRPTGRACVRPYLRVDSRLHDRSLHGVCVFHRLTFYICFASASLVLGSDPPAQQSWCTRSTFDTSCTKTAPAALPAPVPSAHANQQLRVARITIGLHRAHPLVFALLLVRSFALARTGLAERQQNLHGCSLQRTGPCPSTPNLLTRCSHSTCKTAGQQQAL